MHAHHARGDAVEPSARCSGEQGAWRHDGRTEPVATVAARPSNGLAPRGHSRRCSGRSFTQVGGFSPPFHNAGVARVNFDGLVDMRATMQSMVRAVGRVVLRRTLAP